MEIFKDAGSFFTMWETNASPVVIFGAGKRGRIWANYLQNMHIPIFAVCDNDKTGYLKTHYLEDEYPQEYLEEELIRIISPMNLGNDVEYYILLSMESEEMQQRIMDQLQQLAVSCKVFIRDAYQKLPMPECKERILTFAVNQEDVILYHALRKVESVFYLDVGANDPWHYSLTQLFYLNNGRGINIEANILYYDLLTKSRKRDITLNVAIGDKPGVADFPLDHGGAGSLNQKYLALIKNKEFGGRKGRYGRVKVDTLANIVEQYVPEGQEIHFCKIDTEGYEEKCLLGMDWNNYRPWIFCIESVLQEEHATNRTDLKWEYLLKENGYTAALMDLNNKYYVANEHKELVKELLPRWYLFQLYDCYRPDRLGTYTMAPEDCYFWEEEKGQPINTADSPCP